MSKINSLKNKSYYNMKKGREYRESYIEVLGMRKYETQNKNPTNGNK